MTEAEKAVIEAALALRLSLAKSWREGQPCQLDPDGPEFMKLRMACKNLTFERERLTTSDSENLRLAGRAVILAARRYVRAKSGLSSSWTKRLYVELSGAVYDFNCAVRRVKGVTDRP